MSFSLPVSMTKNRCVRVHLTGRFLLSVGMTRAGLGGCFSSLNFFKLLKFFNFLALTRSQIRKDGITGIKTPSLPDFAS
ncbi:MAG: hypothetical protein LBR26_06150 [Prevotella sp.]|nr:hypothetical protein [Prevotella sp.]